MKYVIVMDVIEYGIVFSDGISHKDVYKYPAQIVSAGFCHLGLSLNNDINFECWGESESLGLKSRGVVDSRILNTKVNN